MIPDDEFKAEFGKVMSDEEMREALATFVELVEGKGGIGNIPTALQTLGLIVASLVAERKRPYG
jgi:hypothetical protein